MSEIPLEPSYSKTLLNSAEMSCSIEVLTLLSLLSAESLFYMPSTGQREAAALCHRRFADENSDHVTLLNVYQAYTEEAVGAPEDAATGTGAGKAGGRKKKKRMVMTSKQRAWCQDHYINHRALLRAMDIRVQLEDHCVRMGIPLVSCEQDRDAVLRCLVTGCFLQVQWWRGWRSESGEFSGIKWKGGYEIPASLWYHGDNGGMDMDVG